jgi:hypothetical protein
MRPYWLALLISVVGCSGEIVSDHGTPPPPPPAGGDTIDAATPPPPPPGEEPDADTTTPPPAEEPDAAPPPGDNLMWRKANLTNFESYPDPGSDECENFNGCEWAGRFAFVNGQQSEQWVMDHNIVAVHSRDANRYKLKTLRLKQDGHQLDVKVYDMCSDNDCGGCCTRNAAETGFLIDIEKYTMQRFGSGDGIVDWTCVDCN